MVFVSTVRIIFRLDKPIGKLEPSGEVQRFRDASTAERRRPSFQTVWKLILRFFKAVSSANGTGGKGQGERMKRSVLKWTSSGAK